MRFERHNDNWITGGIYIHLLTTDLNIVTSTQGKYITARCIRGKLKNLNKNTQCDHRDTRNTTECHRCQSQITVKVLKYETIACIGSAPGSMAGQNLYITGQSPGSAPACPATQALSAKSDCAENEVRISRHHKCLIFMCISS